MSEQSLAGKAALITGASGGIGAAIARSLAEQGVRLGLASRSGADLDLPDVAAFRCDVRDAAQVAAAVDGTVTRFGRLDILVVNAGVGAYGPFAELGQDDLEEMIDVNVKGMLYTVRAALPHLTTAGAAGGADLVTIASEAGRRGLPGESVYVASKFAQVGFTRSLDHELREQGIRCVNICPGGVATGFGMGRGLRYPDMPELADMMRDTDVADLVRFVLTRPRNHRILEVAFRHMSEASFG
ncbi:MAG TPA: SDR family oxidoreductase [Pseudonocardiaceae bacterium]|nr:SDR family oxidoreductase [Pseudonocardiaceae bacterium]